MISVCVFFQQIINLLQCDSLTEFILAEKMSEIFSGDKNSLYFPAVIRLGQKNSLT